MYNYIYNERIYEMPMDLFYNYEIRNGLSDELVQELCAKAIDKHIPMTVDVVKKLFQAEHSNKTEEFIDNYSIRGTMKAIPLDVNETIKEELTQKFRENQRFHGRVPRIIDSISRIAKLYKKYEIEEENTSFISRFHINAVSNMLNAGVPSGQAVLLYMRYTPDQCNLLANRTDLVENICTLLLKGYKEKDISFLNAADWITEHLQTDTKTLKKLAKEADRVTLNKDSTVESVKTKLSNVKALKEVEKVEKQYKKAKFKLSKCKCELKGVEQQSENGDYIAYIMNPTDERQVMLGYDTFCCQKLYDVGESAMMHGLLNPKAGFWVIEDKKTGTIKAQAEVWEENENTIVFDNVEFANDAEIGLYKNIFKTWLEDTEYLNVKMGTGYNHMMYEDDFRRSPSAKPSVTPYEVFVISHEEESEAPIFDSEEEAKEALDSGRVTYYDYVYCDSENSAVWLKENGALEPYFDPRQNIMHLINQIENPMQRYYFAGINNIILPTLQQNHEEDFEEDFEEVEEDVDELDWDL